MNGMSRLKAGDASDGDDDSHLKGLFDQADTNNNGKLDRLEIAKLCRQLELKMSKEELNAAMEAMDKKGHGLIGFGPFSSWFKRLNVGYKLTANFLFTPRGSRYRLDSPRFLRVRPLSINLSIRANTLPMLLVGPRRNRRCYRVAARAVGCQPKTLETPRGSEENAPAGAGVLAYAEHTHGAGQEKGVHGSYTRRTWRRDSGSRPTL